MNLLKKTGKLYTLFIGIIVLGVFSSGKQIEKVCNYSDFDEIYQSVKSSDTCYEWEETIINFRNEGMNLVCSLVIPECARKRPIIITLNGFIGNRNGGILPGTNERIWVRLSRMLAENGLASLRVDFRGSGDSDGDYCMTTFSTQISDALATVNYIDSNLKKKVNTKNIGLFGYSQGALVASTAAAVDRRIKSMVLWSPVANAPLCYEGLLTKQGLKDGLAIQDGSTITLGIYVDGQYAADVTLGKGFIQGIFKIDPLTEIKSYEEPLMVVVGINDVIMWPQPDMGELYLKYHNGCEKLLALNTDHYIDSWNSCDKVDEAIYWTTAWFIRTLKLN